MTAAPYTTRLHEAIERKNSPLVVGIDPRLERLPPAVAEAARARHGAGAAWITEALRTFCFGVLDVVAPYTPAVKVNTAFFERHHLAGLAAYAAVVAEARRRGLLVIGDVKRADIGTSAAAYAAGHLGPPPAGAPPAACLTVDAVTVNPYLGADGVIPFIEAAAAQGRGVYVLVRTSNPSSVEVQQLPSPEGAVCERVGRLVARWGEQAGLTDGYAPVGAVVGATCPADLARLRAAMPHTPFLVPGYGAQGGSAADVRSAFDARGLGAVVNSSRAILYAFENRPGAWEEAVEEAARRAARELAAVRHGA